MVTGLYDVTTGYCCYNVGPTYTDALCTCPNNIPSTINSPCRTTFHLIFLHLFFVFLFDRVGSITPTSVTCNRLCVNGGVCNIVNGQSVCWCPLGYSGSNCEIQGIRNTNERIQRTKFVLIFLFRYSKSMLHRTLSSRYLLRTANWSFNLCLLSMFTRLSWFNLQSMYVRIESICRTYFSRCSIRLFHLSTYWCFS